MIKNSIFILLICNIFSNIHASQQKEITALTTPTNQASQPIRPSLRTNNPYQLIQTFTDLGTYRNARNQFSQQMQTPPEIIPTSVWIYRTLRNQGTQPLHKTFSSNF